LLVALTLGGAVIGETTEPGLAATLAIALSMAFKGRMVIDHFMGLKTANRAIRGLMRAYFYVIPLVIVLTSLFGDALARLTTL
jgi:hypothetical protein